MLFLGFKNCIFVIKIYFTFLTTFCGTAADNVNCVILEFINIHNFIDGFSDIK